MKKILIIGGNRFVGLQLSKALQSNYQVTVFNRKGTGAKGVNIIQGDRNNESDIEKILFSDFDIILDFCLFKPEQFELIKNRIPSSTKYIFISSAAIYYNEFGDYGKEKQDCEDLIKLTLNNYLILRPPYIDGPGSHRPRIAFYLKVLKSNLELIKSCEFVAIFYEPNKNGHNFYNSFFVLFSNLSVPNSNMLSIKS